MEERKNKFESTIKPMLEYIGTIGAVLMAIAYVIIVIIMVFGFQYKSSVIDNITFALINAIIGFIIMQLLKIQGIDFAKNLEENKPILKEYYNTKTKDKVVRSIGHYWITSIIKDVLIKAMSICVMSLGVVYIVIKGSQNYTLLLLAAVNLIMFVCFGILSLTKAYEYYNNNHIPYIMERLKESKEEIIEISEELENDKD